ncbi:histidine kinase [Kribbella qitaiheensis]|uniref:Histidine kinase n=1 Tax=Kribbella qitaiheensis TaxID=1544730 RepID=A0A7G6X923_9ACTN|nr:histidine kinase [Kribbella qitaiheensis]
MTGRFQRPYCHSYGQSGAFGCAATAGSGAGRGKRTSGCIWNCSLGLVHSQRPGASAGAAGYSARSRGNRAHQTPSGLGLRDWVDSARADADRQLPGLHCGSSALLRAVSDSWTPQPAYRAGSARGGRSRCGGDGPARLRSGGCGRAVRDDVAGAWVCGYVVAQQRLHSREFVLQQERMRIARELHDIVAHSMSVITVQAAYGHLIIDERPAEARIPRGDRGRRTAYPRRAAATARRASIGAERSGGARSGAGAGPVGSVDRAHRLRRGRGAADRDRSACRRTGGDRPVGVPDRSGSTDECRQARGDRNGRGAHRLPPERAGDQGH